MRQLGYFRSAPWSVYIDPQFDHAIDKSLDTNRRSKLVQNKNKFNFNFFFKDSELDISLPNQARCLLLAFAKSRRVFVQSKAQGA